MTTTVSKEKIVQADTIIIGKYTFARATDPGAKLKFSIYKANDREDVFTFAVSPHKDQQLKIDVLHQDGDHEMRLPSYSTIILEDKTEIDGILGSSFPSAVLKVVEKANEYYRRQKIWLDGGFEIAIRRLFLEGILADSTQLGQTLRTSSA